MQKTSSFEEMNASSNVMRIAVGITAAQENSAGRDHDHETTSKSIPRRNPPADGQLVFVKRGHDTHKAEMLLEEGHNYIE
ncbi:unnamed protein product, partial [Amoebophrya sp. A25]|eukprot:GSA25T00017138001.1